jgi:hypothetical protein
MLIIQNRNAQLFVSSIINVVAVGSCILCPWSHWYQCGVSKDVVQVLFDKAVWQVCMAGKASEAVMHMGSYFFARFMSIFWQINEEALPNVLGFTNSTQTITNDMGTTNVALENHKDANIEECKLSKSLLSLSKYNPFNLGSGENTKKSREF